jgi:hypothetical protein
MDEVMVRVDLGGCPPRPPADPGLHITRTRFLISRFRCATQQAVDHPWPW